jgi:hypothetical protein
MPAIAFEIKRRADASGETIFMLVHLLSAAART